MKSYILIDRSGSMGGTWAEIGPSVDAYGAKLPAGTDICAIVFDNYIDEIWDGKRSGLKDALAKVRPRGMTAIYDAIGHLGEKIAADSPDKAQIVIMTDGWENASQKLNNAQARAILTEWESAKGYDVIYMGANFDSIGEQAAAMGGAMNKAVNVSGGDYRSTMAAVGARGTSYFAGQTMSYDDLEDTITTAAETKKAVPGEGADAS